MSCANHREKSLFRFKPLSLWTRLCCRAAAGALTRAHYCVHRFTGCFALTGSVDAWYCYTLQCSYSVRNYSRFRVRYHSRCAVFRQRGKAPGFIMERHTFCGIDLNISLSRLQNNENKRNGIFPRAEWCNYHNPTKPRIESTMIELKFNRTRVQMDFSFFAVIALFMLFDKDGFGITAFICCVIHELAHLIVMLIFGIPAEQITFYGAGIRIFSSRIEYEKPLRRVIVLSAGCALNFLCAVIFALTGYDLAAVISLFTGIFNLLPIGELDGAALVRMLIINVCKPENVDHIMKIISVMAIVICSVALIFIGGFSVTLPITIAYLIIMESGKF